MNVEFKNLIFGNGVKRDLIADDVTFSYLKEAITLVDSSVQEFCPHYIHNYEYDTISENMIEFLSE